MANDFQPTGSWIAAFRTSLLNAFDEASMDLLVIDYFTPKTFANVAPSGLNKPFANRLQELINDARMENYLLSLVAAAAERRPKNATLRTIAQDLSLTSAGPRLNNHTGKPLQALVQANAKFITPSVFVQKLAELESKLCKVELPGGGGTGFLVGPDLVLTNQHVVAPIKAKTVAWQDVTLRFDYRAGPDGTVLNESRQTTVKLAEDWLVKDSPPSLHDQDDLPGDARADECDFALLRLNAAVGNEPVGGPTLDQKVPVRSWIDASSATPAVVAQNEVFLLQHALGEPLTLTIGTVTMFNGAGTRVRYNANSRKGSSGSPCFNADLQLVALHHAQDFNDPPAWNQAIPFGRIQTMYTAFQKP